MSNVNSHGNSSAPAWSDLLVRAVKEPGIISTAYTAFHSYSIGNQLLAAFQCHARDLAIGPLRTYAGWQTLGRQVQRGQKALTLCQPVTKKVENEDGSEEVRVWFNYKPAWFVLCQTDGADLPPVELPSWSKEKALKELDVTEKPFQHMDGNVMGYAKKREVSISPLSFAPAKTLFHELGHLVLGHTSEGEFNEGADVPKNLREVEAEAVALLLCETLGQPGADYCRGYIQNWLHDQEIPEKNARRIFAAADQILKAGQVQSQVVAS